MGKITIITKNRREIIDLTEDIESAISASNKNDGLIVLNIVHTTAALTTADLDPGTDLDMLDAFDGMVPRLSYRHPHDPSHVKDHILASMIGSQLIIPFDAGKLILGVWQRPVIVEFNGPKKRTIYVKFII
ncbi:hypothetical protein A3C23_05280 [Candidatus Roizmanbacteria bacterium RIFCSPHIGHO2_02_FULL_37_13b]|uniref:Secondary thiamine-phosphate synthase enzyme n=1 Tax=Candidatus Roizmanbacteria bacterium RIFCSPLOWO2_02_FULL_36_11 TaxID=1802071 RepID=A0A1F7JCJ9_9BACT|nr:MAG: hypothetical protein A3C23_05280 [Candidatus Roizmanbacteria bacterium RIFCSPHIGHO2_02_FULL_37_13b]OGK53344.1 MAG: hypothetical protein A3H78_03510 [Candidatus Roizmanbacteria bacterium RIFCSPLOWO2_02_FULL_36_11]